MATEASQRDKSVKERERETVIDFPETGGGRIVRLGENCSAIRIGYVYSARPLCCTWIIRSSCQSW